MAVANPPSGIPAESWYKNRLQEYVQKASMPLPVYQTISEGAPHAPQFRSKVWVDGTCFTSPDAFSNRKMAEQNAAKHALIGILEKVKNEGRSHVIQDTMFCKSIINEYVLKMNMNAPIYETNESKAMLPVFTSSLVLNGLTFIGEAARNKKEAEQFAARSAILSILDSEPGTTMSEIVKSKFKFYDALKKLRESSNVQGVIVPDGVGPLENTGAQVEVVGIDGAQVEVVGTDSAQVEIVGTDGAQAEVTGTDGAQVEVTGTGNTDLLAANSLSTSAVVPIQVGLPQFTSETLSITQGTHQSLHEFKKPKLQSPLPELAPPIVFVPPASQQPPVRSTSRKKRKNKRAKKKMKTQSSSAMEVLPDNQVHAC